MKTIILILIFILASNLNVISQNFSFDYDNAGNRIQRTVVLSTKFVSQETVVANNEDINDEDLEEENLIEQLACFDLLVYPNPTKGEVVVKIIGDEIIESGNYNVYDLSGREILYGKADSYEMTINLKNQVPGTYSLLVNLNGKEKSWKIVKE